jgi:hypothetical protein
MYVFSASTKRSHECWASGGGGGSGGVVGEQIHRQASTSPVRPGLVSMASPAPASPSSSNASVRKKMVSPVFQSFIFFHFPVIVDFTDDVLCRCRSPMDRNYDRRNRRQSRRPQLRRRSR